MLTLRDYVNWGLTHCDKTASAEGVPLILENCVGNKKMKQLEVYGNSVQNGTPSPESPIEVESVGEKCTKNLYDVEQFEAELQHGYVLNEDGIKTSDNNSTYSTYRIPIHEGQSIHIYGWFQRFYVYDANDVFVKRSSNYINTIMNSTYTPTEDGYIRLQIKNANYNANKGKEQIELGDVHTEYEPYGKFKIPVTVRGKNLFKPTKVSGSGIKNDGVLVLKGGYGTTIDSTDFSDNKVVVTQVPNENYATSSYQNGYICFLIPELVKGKIYTLSFDMNIIANPLNATNFVIYVGTTTNKVILLSSATRYSYTFSFTPRTDRPQQVEIRCGGMSFELSNVMITEEGQDDTFEPYVEPIATNIYIKEPLRKIGDYADYIDSKAKKVIRNTLKRIYDGVHDTNNPFNIADNETPWEVTSASEKFWQCTLNDLLPVIPKSGYADYKQIPICLQLPVKTGYFNSTSTPATVDKELIWYSQLARNVRLFLSKDRFDGTLTGIKTYLKANPISVLIATYEPYEEPIECELPILTAKTTVIEIDTSVLPSNIKGKYIKR